MKINEMCKKAHQAAVDSGFWDCPFFDGGTCANGIEFEGVTEISSDYCDNKCKSNFLRERNKGELLMLIVSELGEALEALRKDRRQKQSLVKEIGTECIVNRVVFDTWEKDTYEDELADVAIRLFDLCGSEDIDLEWQIEQKMRYNKTRPKKHGKKF